MKLEKVSLRKASGILEEIEDSNKPTRVEPEKMGAVDLSDPHEVEEREAKVRAVIDKRLERHREEAMETKAPDNAVLPGPNKANESKEAKSTGNGLEERLCRDRKEVGELVEALRARGVRNPFVQRVNEGENRYRVTYRPATGKVCEGTGKDALEWCVNNLSEGDTVAVTPDLLNALRECLEASNGNSKVAEAKAEEAREPAITESTNEADGEDPRGDYRPARDQAYYGILYTTRDGVEERGETFGSRREARKFASSMDRGNLRGYRIARFTCPDAVSPDKWFEETEVEDGDIVYSRTFKPATEAREESRVPAFSRKATVNYRDSIPAQTDDDNMDSPVAFNEAEAHALIGDKPIVESNGTVDPIAQSNDFATTSMADTEIMAMADDDNI